MTDVPLLPLYIAAALTSKMWCFVWFAAGFLMVSDERDDRQNRAAVIVVRYIPFILIAPIPFDALLVMASITHGMIITRRPTLPRAPDSVP